MFHFIFWLVLCWREMGLPYFYTYWNAMFWMVEELPSSSPQISKKSCSFVLKYSLAKLFWNSTRYFSVFLKFWLFDFFPRLRLYREGVARDTLSVRYCTWKNLFHHFQIPVNCHSTAETEVCGVLRHVWGVKCPNQVLKTVWAERQVPNSVSLSIGQSDQDPVLGWKPSLLQNNYWKCFRILQELKILLVS